MLARRRFLQFSGAAVASSLLAPALAQPSLVARGPSGLGGGYGPGAVARLSKRERRDAGPVQSGHRADGRDFNICHGATLVLISRATKRVAERAISLRILTLVTDDSKVAPRLLRLN